MKIVRKVFCWYCKLFFNFVECNKIKFLLIFTCNNNCKCANIFYKLFVHMKLTQKHQWRKIVYVNLLCKYNKFKFLLIFLQYLLNGLLSRVK